MPLDPSIILQAGQGVTPLQNPMDIAGKGLQLQAMMQQAQRARQQMQDQADFRAQYGMSPGMAQAAQKLQLGNLETQKAQHEAQKAHLEAVNSLNQQQMQVLSTVKDQATWDAARQKMAENAKLLFPQLDTSKSDDPPIYPGPEFIQNKIKGLQTFDQQLKTAELAMKQQELGKFSGFHAGADQIAYQTNAQGQARPIMGPDGRPLRVPPPMTAITMQQMNSQYDGSTPLPKGMEVIAQAIANGDQDMMTSARTMPRFADINARAAALREQKDLPPEEKNLLGKSKVAARAAGIKDFEPQGKSGQTVIALNTMTEHLNTAERLAKALQNGDIQMLNRARQAFQQQTGSPAPTDFATIKEFLAGEVAKVAAGGHLTEGEIKQAAERLSQAQSPAQLSGALATMREVAGGKLVALNQDYQRLTGKTLAQGGRLTPATQQAFQTAAQHISGGAAAPSEKPKLGTVMDGYVFLGGDPADPKRWKKQ